MMAGIHPDELDLLSYAEGDLGGTKRASVAEHVAACPDCGSRIRELERARDVLRAAPALEFPAHRRTTAELPRRADERRVYVSPMRLVTVLTPIAAVIALVVALASLPTGGEDSGGAGAEATPAQGDAGGAEAGEEAGATELSASARLVRRVEGPADEVAAVLRSRGFDAAVVDGAVVVRNANQSAVRAALASRPRGPVRVVRDPP